MNKKNNIRLMDRLSDLAVATIILSIAMIVFGLSMIVGSMISVYTGHSIVHGSSILMISLLQGIGYIADGIILAAFCTLVATTSPFALPMKILHCFSAIATIYNAVVVITCMFIGKSAIGHVVTIACLSISGIILFLIRQLEASARKMVAEKLSRKVSSIKRPAA